MNRFFVFCLLLLILLSCSKKTPEEIDPFIYLSGSLQEGETLANALIDEGIENATVYKFVNKMDSIYNLRRAQPADSFVVRLDTLDVMHELIYIPDKIHTYRVIRDTADVFLTQIDTLKLVKEIDTFEGVMESSLWNAVIDGGEGPALAVMMSQIFQWDIDFFIDPQKGNSFTLAFEQYKTESGEFIKYGEILVAQYTSRNYDNIAYRYTNNKGISKYYDENGKSFQKAFLKSPLNYRRISSYFGMRRHPITKKSWMHNGVDYAAAYGTPVEASADGTIIHGGWKGGHPSVNGRTGGYGKTIIIRHANGYKTLYGHLSSYGKYKVGNKVKQHDIIGYVGSTGLSTGNHLHYTIYQYEKAINPLRLKNVSGPPVPKGEMELFQIHVDSLRTYLFNPDVSNLEIDNLTK
ncbi:MAG: M23 family metallopeptidase [Candidatus Cloacimonetes bacterium]|nr:M23 family metallopeptidase [Candidatus Cloacimonadota bacterium]MBL7148720.1 M23 family metallopeptidase [Candidatus Cloacimonadota bacterium]